MSGAAVRIDDETGVELRLEHLPTPRGRLYSATSRPPGAHTCVLICSSVFADFSANYHRERLLGRSLVAQGIGVIRFHYVGEGNSEGDREAMTFSSLCEDAAAVLEYGRSLGFSEFALLGTRIGALVAASTAASMPAAPLALWEPVVDPLRFLTEADRARRMSQLAKGGEGSKIGWREELARNGVLDLIGYEVYPPFIESLEDADLVGSLGPPPRRIFVVRFRGKGGATDPLVQALSERGFMLELETADLSEAWWFHSERVPETGDLITTTTEWLTNALRVAA